MDLTVVEGCIKLYKTHALQLPHNTKILSGESVCISLKLALKTSLLSILHTLTRGFPTGMCMATLCVCSNACSNIFVFYHHLNIESQSVNPTRRRPWYYTPLYIFANFRSSSMSLS